MTRILEISFIPQVEDVIRELGYKLTREPSKVPNRKLWQNDPASLVRGLRYRPDILVERGKKFAIVEVKTRPVTGCEPLLRAPPEMGPHVVVF